jgi:hypothetical protein
MLKNTGYVFFPPLEFIRNKFQQVVMLLNLEPCIESVESGLHTGAVDSLSKIMSFSVYSERVYGRKSGRT